MAKTFEELITAIQENENPSIIATKINIFISNKLREGELSLYEAYTLNGEVLNLERRVYTKMVWRRTTRISNCIAFVNQILIAILFDEIEYSEKLKEMAKEAFKLNTEKRSHYIMDNFDMYINAANNEELLKEIAGKRVRYDIALEKYLAGKRVTRDEWKEFQEDNGPFLTETFPLDKFEPENLLLSKETFNEEKKLSKEVEDVIVEIAMKW